jgi:type II secretory pathway component PulF
MATYSIVEETPIYYLIDVSFDGKTFRQLIASELVNGDLDNMLQEYADQYEHEYMQSALEAPV